LYSGLVTTGGALGCIAGGWFSDLIIRSTTERRWTRRWCGGGALALSAASLWCVRYCDHALAATLCNAAALFFLQVSIPTWWTVVAEISGPHGASMWGLMNSLGGVGVFVMNLLVGRFVEAREKAGLPKLECWRPVFDGVAVALAIGALCWLLVDAKRSIVEPAKHQPEA
jgi:MFS family permease